MFYMWSLNPRPKNRNLSTQHIATLLAQHLRNPAKRSQHFNATDISQNCWAQHVIKMISIEMCYICYQSGQFHHHRIHLFNCTDSISGVFTSSIKHQSCTIIVHLFLSTNTNDEKSHSSEIRFTEILCLQNFSLSYSLSPLLPLYRLINKLIKVLRNYRLLNNNCNYEAQDVLN